MNKLYIVTSFIFWLILNTSRADGLETDANIVGHVQCKGEHIPFINISIDGTTIGTTTDATGHYQLINLPIGTHTVRISGMGYKPETREITTVANKTIEIKFIIEEDALNLEGVVVSADRNQSSRAEAPAIVNTISPKLFDITQSVNIAEGLCFTPGLRTECNCQNCGFTQLRMNGMEGPYSQILMNSRPVFSGLAGVYGLELIPSNMVERIEVVRGGGSVLYGGNAIAGTVNIITKEPTANTFLMDARYSLIGIGGHEGTKAAGDGQLNLNASVVSEDGKTGGFIYGMFREKEAHDENGDDYSESVLIKNTTLGFSTYYKPSTKSKLTLDGYRISEFRRGGNKLDYLPHEADVAEQVGHTITGANMAYDLFTNNKYDKLTIFAAGQVVDRESYYGARQDPYGYGHSDDLTTSIGAQYILNTDKFLFAPSTTIFGIDNNNNTLNDEKLGANGNPNTIITHQMVNTLGTFIQQDWKSEKFNLSAGLRFDSYLVQDLHGNNEERAEDFSNQVLAPRISGLYKFTPRIRVRVGYAKGYRAPQIFNEDLHIELVNASRVFHFNAENLTQETSHSFTTSINTNFPIASTMIDILIEGFYTRLNNAFADEYYPLDTMGNFAYKRVNSDGGAYVAGINFEFNSHLLEMLDMQIGFTIQQNQFENPQQWGDNEDSYSKNFIRTPNTYGYGTFSWQMTKLINTTLSFNYTGSMDVPHFGLDPETTDELEREAIENGDVITGERLERSEDFFIIDLLFKHDFKLTKEVKIQIYTGIKNVFNQTQKKHDSGMFRDAGYIYGPCQPRTFNLGIKLGNIL